MFPMTLAEHVDSLVVEYHQLARKLDAPDDSVKLRNLLIAEGEWSAKGAEAIAHLARHYGTFVLSNALALAEALKIEDGDAGI